MTPRRPKLLAAVVFGLVLTGCASVVRAGPRTVAVHGAEPSGTTTSSATATLPTPAPVRMVRWRGPVEQMFVHPLVLRPALAFTSDQLGQGFQHYFVTALEFRRILQQLWRNGWTLVDPRRVAKGDVRVPAGRRPLVLQEDDVNYYRYFEGRGLARRLVLVDGAVEAEVVDGHGRHLTDQDVVPMTDAMVAAHPLFSADGAKGLLAVTAYEGFFGERDLTNPAARARVRALVTQLRATGWVIASHTYGHIDLSADSLDAIARDTARWKAAAKGLLGPVHILVYPFGARPTSAGLDLLRREGFTIQYDIDVQPNRRIEDGVVLMSRRHIDGYSFAVPSALAKFFAVATVRDPRRPPA